MPFQCMRTIHEHFRFDDWHELLLLTKGSIPGQPPKKAAVLRQLVEYCATKGQAIADSMGYIPLPASVVEKIKVASAEIK